MCRPGQTDSSLVPRVHWRRFARICHFITRPGADQPHQYFHRRALPLPAVDVLLIKQFRRRLGRGEASHQQSVVEIIHIAAETLHQQQQQQK